jgi:amidase
MPLLDPPRSFDGIVRKISVAGASTGPLAGTTFVAKDLYDVQGYPTGAGNPDWERTHGIAGETAPAVRLLLEAGATLVGKSCTDELAFSLDGINIHYGTPVNPRFPDRLPGGSSSGSVSAVAAGLVDFAMGTDTSGSIRVPASYCGVYGFRPSHGAVPLGGVVPLAPTFDTAGWLARDGRMLARCGRVLLGGKGTAHGFQTLGVLADAFDLVDNRLVEPLRAKVKSIQSVFATMREIRLSEDGLQTWLGTFRTLKQWEAWQAHGEWIRAVHPHFAPNIEASFESASRITDAERRRALDERERLMGTLRRHLEGDTVLCLPSAWTIAPLKTAPAEELAANRVKDLTLGSVASLSGSPQVSIPVVTESYAIGLGLLAAPGNDTRLLALAELLAS